MKEKIETSSIQNHESPETTMKHYASTNEQSEKITVRNDYIIYKDGEPFIIVQFKDVLGRWVVYLGSILVKSYGDRYEAIKAADEMAESVGLVVYP